MPLFLPEPVGFRQLDHFIAATADDGAQHIKTKTFGLLKFNLWRDRQFFFGNHHVHQRRAIMAEGLLQRFIQLSRLFLREYL